MYHIISNKIVVPVIYAFIKYKLHYYALGKILVINNYIFNNYYLHCKRCNITLGYFVSFNSFKIF